MKEMWVSMQGKNIAEFKKGHIICSKNPVDTGSEPVYIRTEAEERALKYPFANVRSVIESRKNRIIKNARNSKNIPNCKVVYDYYMDLERAIKEDIENLDKGTG